MWRDERMMTTDLRAPRETRDMRRATRKVDFEDSQAYAIPRDLGEIPRTYLLRTLFVNQPALQADLWQLLKDRDDCPFDSYAHLDMTLRVALHQNWVVREKNQSDRKWYLSVHPQRGDDIAAALAEGRNAEREAEAGAEAAAAAAAEERHATRREAVAAAIRDLQHQIAVNVAVLTEQDRTLLKELPYVQPDGSIDYCWYSEGGSEPFLTRVVDAPEAAATDDAADTTFDEEHDAAAADGHDDGAAEAEAATNARR